MVKKKHDKSHFSSCSFYVCWTKVEAAKEEGIRAWGKQFYALAPCHVDFMGHFYWLVSKRGSYQQTHCAMIMLYHRLSLVARLWQRPFLNLSRCTTQDHWLGATITEIATTVSRSQSFVWDSRKSCSVFWALNKRHAKYAEWGERGLELRITGLIWMNTAGSMSKFKVYIDRSLIRLMI